MLTSLVYLRQENNKKSKQVMKIVNIDEKDLHMFRSYCLLKILKLEKKKKRNSKGFTLPLENTVLQKPQGWSN